MRYLFIGTWSTAILIVTNLAQTANLQQSPVIKKERCKGKLKKTCQQDLFHLNQS